MTGPADPADLRAELADWPVGRAAVAVVDAKGVRASYGEAGPLAWASLTKLLTGLTVLQAAADGLVDLDEPAGPPGATVRHLLAHASGLALDSDQVLAAPGRRRIYSNRGIEVAAELVAERAGQPFGDLLAARLLGPLGMAGTTLDGSPAHGARGPVADLAVLARELLAPRVLDPATVTAATTTAFPGLAGVLPGFGRQDPNDWALAFEVRDAKSPHWTGAGNSPGTVGHFGQAGGFLWVDPAAGIGCVSLSDTAFGPWSAQRWPRLSDRVLAAYAAAG